MLQFLCPTFSVHSITECSYLIPPSLHWFCVCCHISLGWDRSPSDVQVHHARKGLFPLWDIRHWSSGWGPLQAGLQLWGLPGCHGEVRTKHSSHYLKHATTRRTISFICCQVNKQVKLPLAGSLEARVKQGSAEPRCCVQFCFLSRPSWSWRGNRIWHNINCVNWQYEKPLKVVTKLMLMLAQVDYLTATKL